MTAQLDWICPKCGVVLGKAEVPQSAILEVWRRHMLGAHSTKGAKVNRTKDRPNRTNGIRYAGSPSKSGLAKDLQAKTKRHRTVEQRDFEDREWEPNPVGGPMHQSPPKVGADGVALYEKSLISKGAWEILLKRMGQQPTTETNAAPESIYSDGTRNDAIEKAQTTAEGTSGDDDRSDVASKLRQRLMAHLRSLDSISKQPSVLPLCSDSEFKEAQQICRTLMARLEVLTSKKRN